MSHTVDLYNNVYSDFTSAAEAAVRQAAFGEDIGQTSWITAQDWLGYADRVNVREGSRVLEVGSGSGGPAVYLAERRNCHVTGVDLNEHGVQNGQRLGAARGIGDKVAFQRVDASRPLPFADASFDAILSNDAMCHIANRLEVLQDWYRVLRPGGRLLFTDAMVLTGLVSQEEVATRTSIGFYLLVPPGENERLIVRAGFTLMATDDMTAPAELIAARWHAAREQHRVELVSREGEANFDGLQRFLACVHRVSAEHRLSRYCYLAEKAS
jgi:SAM-dependent methyltransferase